MAPHYLPNLHAEIRYSPLPITEYKAGPKGAEYGPAISSMLTTAGAWNLAYLSHDFERTMLHGVP